MLYNGKHACDEGSNWSIISKEEIEFTSRRVHISLMSGMIIY